MKNILKHTAILLILFSSQFTMAQDSIQVKSRKLTYSIGYSHLRMLDKQVTPLIYNANIIPIKIGYETKKGAGIWSFDLELGLGMNGSSAYNSRTVQRPYTNNEGGLEYEELELAKTAIIQQEINVQYLTMWNKFSTEKTQIYIGGKFKEFFSISMVPTAVSVINEISINPVIAVSHQIKHSIKLKSSMSIPLTGLMIRLPYANDPADGKNGTFKAVYAMGTKFFTPLEYQRINFDIGIEKILTDKWTIGVQYDFYWLHYSDKGGISAYNNGITVKFIKTL